MNSKYLYLLCLKLCCQLLIVSESSTLQTNIFPQEKVYETVHDEFDEWLDGEGRNFFLNEGPPFHNEVGLKIPIFAFKLPGADETEATGIHANALGAIGFSTLFVMGAIGLAYYTSTQSEGEGGHERERGRENGYKSRDERCYGKSNCKGNGILHQVYDSLSELPDLLNIESCFQLSVCSAYSKPKKYRMLFWALRYLVQSRTDESDSMKLKKYQKAAILGSKNLDCYEEYPCTIQPLDFIMYLKDYFT